MSCGRKEAPLTYFLFSCLYILIIIHQLEKCKIKCFRAFCLTVFQCGLTTNLIQKPNLSLFIYRSHIQIEKQHLYIIQILQSTVIMKIYATQRPSHSFLSNSVVCQQLTHLTLYLKCHFLKRR